MIDTEPVLKQLAQLSREASAKESAFLQHILLVASSTFGILISLHPSVPEYRYSRLGFVLSVAILGLAILCNAIALFAQSRLPRRAQKDLSEEGRAAIRENRPVNQICVQRKKYHVFCERATYILLVVALISLCSYAVCNAFAL